MVESNVYNFGTAKPEEVINWKFKFTETGEIEYISTGCSCTKATSFKDGVLEGTLDMKLAGSYVQGENSINKPVTVYMKDGKTHYVAGENLVMKVNPEKSIYRLTITGLVIKE